MEPNTNHEQFQDHKGCEYEVYIEHQQNLFNINEQMNNVFNINEKSWIKVLK